MNEHGIGGTIDVERLYYRSQFDDWLAGGTMSIGTATCAWRARDGGAGYGWDVETVHESRDWADTTEEQVDAAFEALMRVLAEHPTTYRF